MDINQIKMNSLMGGKDQDIDASSMVSADDNSEVLCLYFLFLFVFGDGCSFRKKRAS